MSEAQSVSSRRYRIAVAEDPRAFFGRWKWSIHAPGQDIISMKNPWRGVLDGHYAFGETMTKKAAYREAHRWIRKFQKDVELHGEKPIPEWTEVVA